MRRTKQEANATRQRIITAALRMFARHGITRTTLEQVARAANVTRGAVYWHFKGKRELVRAVRDTVSVPFLDRVDLALLRSPGDDPLQRIQRYLESLVSDIEHDRTLRLTFEVMSFKCEYVGEFAVEREAMCRNTQRMQKALAQAYSESAEDGLLRTGVTPDVAAFETIAFLTGLCRLLLLDASRFGGSAAARDAIAAHVQGQRRTLIAAPPASRGRTARRLRVLEQSTRP